MCGGGVAAECVHTLVLCLLHVGRLPPHGCWHRIGCGLNVTHLDVRGMCKWDLLRFRKGHHLSAVWHVVGPGERGWLGVSCVSDLLMISLPLHVACMLLICLCTDGPTGQQCLLAVTRLFFFALRPT